jgi:hypothetical protein
LRQRGSPEEGARIDGSGPHEVDASGREASLDDAHVRELDILLSKRDHSPIGVHEDVPPVVAAVQATMLAASPGSGAPAGTGDAGEALSDGPERPRTMISETAISASTAVAAAYLSRLRRARCLASSISASGSAPADAGSSCSGSSRDGGRGGAVTLIKPSSLSSHLPTLRHQVLNLIHRRVQLVRAAPRVIKRQANLAAFPSSIGAPLKSETSSVRRAMKPSRSVTDSNDVDGRRWRT